jgi:hypothetical protein
VLTDRQTLVGHRHDFEALGTYVIDSVTGLVAATVEPRANNFKDLAVKTSFAAPQQRKLAFRDEQSCVPVIPQLGSGLKFITIAGGAAAPGAASAQGDPRRRCSRATHI